MKRPLALIGLTAMLVLAVCFYADFKVSLWIAALAFVGFIASLVIKRLRKLISPSVFFATVIVAVVVFNMFSLLYVNPLWQSYNKDEESKIEAILCEEGSYDGSKYFYELKVLSVDGEKADFKMMLSSKDAIMCKVGDRLSFSAILNDTTYGKYLANRCYFSAYVYYESVVEVTSAETRPLYYYAVELRDKIRSAFYQELDFDVAALSNAVLLGDNSGFSEEISKNIRYAGLSHVTVVSGLHLSVITMLWTKVFGKLFKNKYADAAVTLVLVFFFLSLTGFGKSSIRAAIMLFVLILSRIFNREGDSLNSLGLAAILLTITNLYVVGDVGVLLSFSATFGIVAFSTPLENFLTKGLAPVDESVHPFINKALRKIAALFSTTFTAAVATLPVTIIFFGRVSLVQIISNLVILPFVQWFMLAAAVTAVLHFIPYIGMLTDVVAFIANLIGKAMLSLTELFASIPMAYVKADYDFVIFWLCSSLGLFLLIYFLRRKGRGLNIICGILSLLILIAGALGHALAYRNTLSLYVTPAHGGQSVILSSKDGNAVLACSGEIYNSDKMIDILETVYSENQLMIISSIDNTASENAEDILEVFDYSGILMYDTDDSSEHAENIRASSENLTETYEDCTVNLWGKGTLSLLKRQGSVYMYLSSGSTTVLILPTAGDVSVLPEDMRSPDVLITSGMLTNMELLSFETLISNGDSLEQSAVIDFYRNREGTKVAVSDTITFDIVG